MFLFQCCAVYFYSVASTMEIMSGFLFLINPKLVKPQSNALVNCSIAISLFEVWRTTL